MEIRALGIAPTAADDSRRISGYAIVWGVRSRIIPSWDGDFIETIEKGAVDDALIARSDVKALYNHDHNALLARSVNGEGTLQLFIDEKGLRFEFDAPNTTVGNDVLELVRRGDLRGCSFAFTVSEENVVYSRDGEEKIRTIRKLSGLYDVSIVVEPAYTQTTVDARSFDALDERPATPSPELLDLRTYIRMSSL